MLNVNAPNSYITLKVAICNKLSNDLERNKLRCVYLAELQVRITVWFKLVRIHARSVPHVHRHKHLDDDATTTG